MATVAQQTNFVNSFLPLAQQQSVATGIPASFILGQAALESGWGTSQAAQTQNNFFGISMGGSGIATYNSPSQGFAAYGNLLTTDPRYAGVLATAASTSDPTALASSLVSSGYNTADPNYISSLVGATASVNNLLGGNNGGTSGVTGTSGGPVTTIDPNTGNVTTSIPAASAGTVATDTTAGTSSSWLGWLGNHTVSIFLVILGIVVVGGSVFLFGFAAIAPPAGLAKNVGKVVRKIGSAAA
jgi:hypothetical protein